MENPKPPLKAFTYYTPESYDSHNCYSLVVFVDTREEADALAVEYLKTSSGNPVNLSDYNVKEVLINKGDVLVVDSYYNPSIEKGG